MPRKISKIISHAKNRLSGKKTSSSSSTGSSIGGSTHSGRPSKSDHHHHHHRSSTGSTSDSSRLLQCYDYDDDRASGIGLLDDEMGQSQASTALAADYDDFESPDLNLQSLDSGRQHQPKGSERAAGGGGGGSGPKPQSSSEPTESLQGQPGRILRSLLSFGRTTGTTTTTTTAVPTQPGYNELYAAEQVKDPNQKHWWQSDFLLGSNTINNQQGPVLFGTWNGVFITTVVHLFGVISFLRIGWMVGLEGWPISMAIVFGCLLFNTISLLAAIGIMERCAASTTAGYGPFSNCCPAAAASSSSSGGGAVINNRFDPEYPKTVAQARANVHILIATVLGSRIGGAISLVYCIGQAVSCALHVTGFTETFVHLCAVWIERQLSNTSTMDSSESLYTNSKNDTTVWIHSGTISTTEKSSSLAIMMARLMHIEIVHPVVAQANQLSDHNPSRLQLILTPETFQLTSMVLILFLFIFNIIGVRWLFRLQTILFLALVTAIADFTAGLFQQHPDFGYGPIRASSEYFSENSHPFMPAHVNGSTTTTTQRWSLWHQLFDVVGVFFPATIGVMAGVNMGSDLQTPTKSIPCGSFMAIMSSYAVHVLFILGLALTCSRMALLNDYAIAQHVSAVGVFFLFGLYMSTISSSLGSMYTAPRIMQNLAQELHSVPVVRCFAKGRGPNNIPINALILFTLVTMGFVMIGGINTLAPIVTIPYLLTYAAIEYAYFSMAMTFDIQIQREKRFMQIASQLKQSDSTQSADLILGHGHQHDDDDQDQDQEEHARPSLMEHRQASASKSINSGKFPPQDDAVSLSMSLGGGGGGATQSTHGVTPMSPSPSLQQQHLAGYGSIQSITQHIKIKRRQSTQSSDSDGEGGDHNLTGMANSKLQKPIKMVQAGSEQHSNKTRTASTGSSKGDGGGGGPRTTAHKTAHKKTIRQLMAAVSNSDDEEDDGDDGDDFDDDQTTTNKDNKDDKDDAAFLDDSCAQEVGDDEINQRREIINENQRMLTHDLDDEDVDHQNPLEQSERLLMPDPELAEIACKQEVWYLRMMNRWIVLIASILKLLLMFFIAWHYALVTITMYLLFCLIIGHFNPGFYPGVSEFSLCKWLRNTWIRLVRFCRPGNGYTNVSSGSGLISSNTQTNLMVASYSYDRIVMPESVQPDFQCQPDQLTKENTDYKDRPPCHFTTNIEPQLN